VADPGFHGGEDATAVPVPVSLPVLGVAGVAIFLWTHYVCSCCLT